MSHTKIEFDDENYIEKILLACGVGSRVAMMSRSSGSGEACHSSIVKIGDEYKIKPFAGEFLRVTEEKLPALIQTWYERACSDWRGLHAIEKVKRNRNGKLPMYVRVTES